MTRIISSNTSNPDNDPQNNPETIKGNGEYRKVKFYSTSWGRYLLIVAGVPYPYNEFKDVTDTIDKLVDDLKN